MEASFCQPLWICSGSSFFASICIPCSYYSLSCFSKYQMESGAAEVAGGDSLLLDPVVSASFVLCFPSYSYFAHMSGAGWSDVMWIRVWLLYEYWQPHNDMGKKKREIFNRNICSVKLSLCLFSFFEQQYVRI